MKTFLWGILPFICIILFFIVPVVRMVVPSCAWRTKASEPLDRQLLSVTTAMFNWGLVLVLAGHGVGLIGGVIGSRQAVDFFFWSAMIGGFLVLVGSIMRLVRRMSVAQLRATSKVEYYIVHVFLSAIVGIALYQVLFHKIFGETYTASSWAASLWTLAPQPALMESASFLTKLHIFLALLFFAYLPFTSLVQSWSLRVNCFVPSPRTIHEQKNQVERKRKVTLRSKNTSLACGLVIVAIGFIIAGGLLGTPSLGGVSNIPTTIESPEGHLLAGYPLYVSQCARCHGVEGYGDGASMDSPTFTALPRSFVVHAEHAGATYHFVSTDNGIASNDDLFRTIERGLEGSGMPAFPNLSSTQIDSLVDVLNEFRAEGLIPGNTIQISEVPQATHATIRLGAALFAQHCVSCHGADGSGGNQINYSWRERSPGSFQPIFAADLSQGKVKFGASAEDIYTRIVVGVPGAFGGGNLMQSFEETLSETERWALVHYVMEEILPSN